MKKVFKVLFVLFFVIFTVSGVLAKALKPIPVDESKTEATARAEVKYETDAKTEQVELEPTTPAVNPQSVYFVNGKKNEPQIKTVDNYIAIFDFEVKTGDKGISSPLTDNIIHELSLSDKYEVIDRGNMNKILGEQKFQMSGCVAQECKVEAGQLLGVGKIVTGSVGLVGKTYYLTLQLIDVKTGKIEISVDDTCKCEVDELLGSTKRLAKKLLGEKVDQPAEERRLEEESASFAKNKTLGEKQNKIAEEREAHALLKDSSKITKNAVLFEERFISNEKEWLVVNDNEKRFEITNGKYILESKKGGQWISTRKIPIDQASDFRIDMTVEKMSGTDDYGYGLVWGLRDLQTYYLFVITGNGYFIHASRDNSSEKRVFSRPEKAINRSNARNNLSLRKSGTTLEFYINNQIVAKTPFEPFFGDYLGCAIYSGHQTITIGFDDIVVSQH